MLTPIDADWPTLDELSLRYLHRVIEHAKGNKTKAAMMLGMDRRTVNRILAKVKRLGITPTMQTAHRSSRTRFREGAAAPATLGEGPAPR